jgi:hypothetical protein
MIGRRGSPVGQSAILTLLPGDHRIGAARLPDRVSGARAAAIACSARARGVVRSPKKHGPGLVPGPCGSSSGASGRLRKGTS